MITFVEKEPHYDDSLFTVKCYLYPTYMVKDTQEYFVFNRREPDEAWKLEENELYKKQLISTDGKFFRFYGWYADPVSMLKEMIARKHHFTTPNKVLSGKIGERGYVDFHGNRKEVSAVFKYRIYDRKLVERLEHIIELVNAKKWDDAMVCVNQVV